MKKVIIYNGSNKGFSKIIPQNNIKNFSELIQEHDNQMRIHTHVVSGQEDDIEDEKYIIENLIIYSNNYSGVAEHVIENFISFIKLFNVENLYIQNPPKHITDELKNMYNQTKIINFNYQVINISILRTINEGFSTRIIGQENVKESLLSALYPLTKKDSKKPIVIMFYGPSGVGKTETAKYIGEILKGTILRKQFSMFQNEDFSTYLFGGKYSQRSFTKDLLERESNVILLDEFDKSHSIFHSAFYELFDEGIMEDKNYKVNVENSIIICTSNYKSIEDVRKSLGDPIYSRLDAVIKFKPLSIDAIYEIIHKEYINEYKKLTKKEKMIIDDVNLEELLKKHAKSFSNVREIKTNIKNIMYLTIIRNIL